MPAVVSEWKRREQKDRLLRRRDQFGDKSLPAQACVGGGSRSALYVEWQGLLLVSGCEVSAVPSQLCLCCLPRPGTGFYWRRKEGRLRTRLGSPEFLHAAQGRGGASCKGQGRWPGSSVFLSSQPALCVLCTPSGSHDPLPGARTLYLTHARLLSLQIWTWCGSPRSLPVVVHVHTNTHTHAHSPHRPPPTEVLAYKY